MSSYVARYSYINALTNNGDSAIHIAARTSQLDMVQLLVEQGGDINIRDNKGKIF